MGGATPADGSTSCFHEGGAGLTFAVAFRSLDARAAPAGMLCYLLEVSEGSNEPRESLSRGTSSRCGFIGVQVYVLIHAAWKRKSLVFFQGNSPPSHVNPTLCRHPEVVRSSSAC